MLLTVTEQKSKKKSSRELVYMSIYTERNWREFLRLSKDLFHTPYPRGKNNVYETRKPKKKRSSRFERCRAQLKRGALLRFCEELDCDAIILDECLRATQSHFTSNSYEEIKSALEATYPKLGAGAGFGLVTCEAVGDLYHGPSDAQRISTRACSSTSRPEASIDLRLVGGLTFLAFALTALSAYTCFLKRRAEKKYNTAVFQGMGNGTGPQA